jgi:hypothetical protein
MISAFSRFRKLVAWSLYGFSLIFAIFVASNSNSQTVEQFPWAAGIFNFYGISQPARVNGPNSNLRVCGFSYETTQWVDGVEVPLTNTFANSNTRHTFQYGNRANFLYAQSCAFSDDYPMTADECEFEFISGIPKQTFEFPTSWSYDALTNTCSSNFASDNVCEEGEFSAECSVACPQSEYFVGGSVGYGQSCGATAGSQVSFIDNPKADYGCVGSGSLSICGTGLQNGGTGSGAGGSHTTSDTFYEYCLSNPQDVECGGTFADSIIPTCQNGQQADPQVGCDWLASDEIVCPSGQQQNSNGACVDFATVQVPIVAPNPAFVGGTVSGGGPSGGGGDSDFDASGIIDAVDKTTDAVEDGNAILSDQLTSLQAIEECLTGDCGELNLPNVLPNDVESVQTAFEVFQSRVSGAPIVTSLGSIVNVANFGNGGTCPAFDLVLFGVPISTILHCTLWETVYPIISTFMMVYWTLIAWRKFTENF